MGAEHWRREQRGAVAVLTFDRPPRNLMSFRAMGELTELLTEVGEDDATNVVVLTGAHPDVFVAHADLEDLGRLGRGDESVGSPLSWPAAMAAITQIPQPVVAAVNGQAWGGGCEICLACTLRVAAASAHFGQPEVVVGIIPGAGGTQRLPRLVGPGRAAELILSGRVIQADEALRIGLVEAVLPDDGFLDAVLAWVAPIAANPRRAVAAAKKAMQEGLDRPLADGLRIEAELFLACQADPDTLDLQDRVSQGGEISGAPAT